MPEEFKELAENRILENKELLVGKVKYNDKVFHQSNNQILHLKELG